MGGDLSFRLADLAARRLRLGEVGRGLLGGDGRLPLQFLLRLARVLAQRRPRVRRRARQRVDPLEIGAHGRRRDDALTLGLVIFLDRFLRGQELFGGDLHRLHLRREPLRREAENVVVIVGEGEERRDREDEDVDESGDRRLEHDPLAQKLLARDQGAEIGAERPGGRGEHRQNGGRADQRADETDPVAGLASHHVDHAARGRIEDPAQHRDRHEEGQPRDLRARKGQARLSLWSLVLSPEERGETRPKSAG